MQSIGIYILGYIARFDFACIYLCLKLKVLPTARMVLFSWASFILSQVFREPELLEDLLS